MLKVSHNYKKQTILVSPQVSTAVSLDPLWLGTKFYEWKQPPGWFT